MLRYHEVAEAFAGRDRTAGCLVVVGVFDGLHVGHKHLLDELLTWARCMDGVAGVDGVAGADGGTRSGEGAGRRAAVVVTFDRHPLEVIRRVTPLRILSREHRFRLLERHGIDAVLELPFTPELARWSADEFVERVLRDGLGAAGLLMGFDSAFGRGRAGTFKALHARQQDLGLEVREGSVAHLGEERVSSTLVRRAITDGDLPRLEELLGRPFSLLGMVVRGDGRGRQLGIPTANLDVEGAAVLPPGVYFAHATLGAEVHGALVNIGVRPTFAGSATPGMVVEAHLVDFDGDLYDQRVGLDFIKRHRGERAFASAADLKAQIDADRRAFRVEVPGLEP